MPGTLSELQSIFDPEWGTAANGERIRRVLKRLRAHVTELIERDDSGEKLSQPQESLFILDLISADIPREVEAKLTEKDLRLIRFALDRAIDSI